ncbi:hypothetical protein BSR29_03270 [Boudabousia liubingyangii]|uniref:ComEC/Rec2-related protein domain-containing protein n=1 Tax=Boudabousia liubingyangii TaxID=1921764 RepID=A0A1Q5PMV6_9ACTO|nr:ComEC/Rec2 family competence protein [Boudabousia liubingyangii]OKL48884.1 hypothetical protein BSR29_03270 [Boudabousia liubingyangii]
MDRQTQSKYQATLPIMTGPWAAVLLANQQVTAASAIPLVFTILMLSYLPTILKLTKNAPTEHTGPWLKSACGRFLVVLVISLLLFGKQQSQHHAVIDLMQGTRKGSASGTTMPKNPAETKQVRELRIRWYQAPRFSMTRHQWVSAGQIITKDQTYRAEILWPSQLPPLPSGTQVVQARLQRVTTLGKPYLKVQVKQVHQTTTTPINRFLAAGAFVRTKYLKQLTQSPGEANAQKLLAAMVLGEKDLPKTVKNQLQRSGISHLTALSGLHLSIVTMLFIYTYGWLKRKDLRGHRKGSALCAIFGILIYLWLVGPSPSLIRAALMATLVTFSVVLGISVRGKQVLALSVPVALYYWPELAGSAGYGLSVLATGAICAYAKPMSEVLPCFLPQKVRQVVSASLLAQIATLPLILALGWQPSLYALPMNLLIAPVIPVILILVLLAVALNLYCPPLAMIVTYPALKLGQLILYLSELISGLPGSALPLPPGPVIPILLSLTGGVIYLQLERIRGTIFRIKNLKQGKLLRDRRN